MNTGVRPHDSDIRVLAYFRAVVGGVIAWEALSLLASGAARRLYVEPEFHFTYFGFSWVRPWPGDGVLWHLAALAAVSLLMAAGAAYRATAPLAFLGFAYVFLLDQAEYLNHFYLIALLALVLSLVPAHRAWSVDASLRPSIRATAFPGWQLQALRAQIAIPYVFAGLAKLDADWLRGEPLRAWMSGRGGVFGAPWAPVTFAWLGLAFDLAIVPALLWRRTRAVAFAAAIAFHVLNAALFEIGAFPWLSILALPLFLPWHAPRPAALAVTPRWASRVLAVHLALQCVLPLRHLAYPGDVSWTEEGHRFSWRMKLRQKSHPLLFALVDPETGERTYARPTEFISARQMSRMSTRPDMILQLAHELARRHERETGRRPRVYVEGLARLNDGEPRPLIDPAVDLASEPRSLAPAKWILR